MILYMNLLIIADVIKYFFIRFLLYWLWGVFATLGDFTIYRSILLERECIFFNYKKNI